jgi:hypothetical protein
MEALDARSAHVLAACSEAPLSWCSAVLPGWAAAFAGSALAQLLVGCSQVRQVGLVAMPLDLPTHVRQQVLRPASAESLAHPAIGSPHNARHPDRCRRRVACHVAPVSGCARNVSPMLCVATKFLLPCSSKVLSALRNRAARLRAGTRNRAWANHLTASGGKPCTTQSHNRQPGASGRHLTRFGPGIRGPDRTAPSTGASGFRGCVSATATGDRPSARAIRDERRACSRRPAPRP